MSQHQLNINEICGGVSEKPILKRFWNEQSKLYLHYKNKEWGLFAKIPCIFCEDRVSKRIGNHEVSALTMDWFNKSYQMRKLIMYY